MDYSKYDFKDSTELYVYLSKKGLSRGTVEEISKLKGEPDWMRDFRLRAYDVFMSKPMPSWGGDLSKIDFQNIYYYAKASEKQGKTWDDVPESVRNTFEKLGIPEAERKFLAGVGAQYESEIVYHNLREDLPKTRCNIYRYRYGREKVPRNYEKAFRKGYSARGQQVCSIE